MKNTFTLFVACVIALVLLAYMFFFQVRYDQVAVVTTFDKVGSNAIRTEPSLYLRWPPPIQKVTTYSTRVQLLEDQLDELLTADGYAIIVSTYMGWKITNPAQFFVSVKDSAAAKDKLNQLMKDLRGVFSQYRFDDLVNTNTEALKLTEIEAKSKEHLQNRIDEQGYGIEVVEVGIRRVLLPDKVTEKVFERMRQTRQRLAENTRAEGRARAAAIRSEAKSAQQRILAFAERRAQTIRSEGDREAATYYEKFKANEQFAIFQRQVEALKKMLAHNTTFVLDANDLSLLQLLKNDGAEPVAVPLRSTAVETPAR